ASLWTSSLSLHDALPIYMQPAPVDVGEDMETAVVVAQHRGPDALAIHILAFLQPVLGPFRERRHGVGHELPVHQVARTQHRQARDRKSTRLNSSHVKISY